MKGTSISFLPVLKDIFSIKNLLKTLTIEYGSLKDYPTFSNIYIFNFRNFGVYMAEEHCQGTCVEEKRVKGYVWNCEEAGRK